MDILWLFLAILPVVVLAGSVLGIHSFLQLRRLRARIDQLEQQLRPDAAQPARPLAAYGTPTPSAPLTSAPVNAPQEKTSDAVDTPQPTPKPTPKPTPQPVQGARAQREPARHRTISARLDASIRNNWMIWLGGICVGLAGVFMVRYSIEEGLLGPAARINLSLIAGGALHLAAEWLRRTRGQHNVFAALAGGASIILYSALFAAFRLLPEVSPGLIFGGMALVSFGSLALALRHGPVLAALGMLGGYLVPVLVSTGSGRIEIALVYICILSLFSLWLLAYVQRRWLWLGVIGGSLAWWGLTLWTAPEDGVRSLYLLVLGYLFLAVPGQDWLLRQQRQPAGRPWWRLLLDNHGERNWPATPALLLLVLAQGSTLALETVGGSSYSTLLLMPLLLLLAASRRPELNPLPALLLGLTALAVILPLLSWNGDRWQFVAASAETQALLIPRLVLLMLLYSGVAVTLVWRKASYPAFWTTLGCAAPLLMVTLGYYLITAFTADWTWGGAAAVLALGYLALAKLSVQRQAADLISVILISAAHLGLSLAAVTWFSNATLTLALAAQLISLAALQRYYQLPLLGWVIRLLLAVLICRLTFNPWLPGYSSDTHWSLWTYGGATLCAFWAAWILRHNHKMQAWLQGAGAHLLVLTLAAEVRYWLYDGDIFRAEYSFLEASLNTAIWGSAGLLYQVRAGMSRYLQRFYRVIAGLHLAAAGGNYLLFVVLAHNPLWSNAPVGTTPLWNLLLLSYGLPTLLLLAGGYLLRGTAGATARLLAGVNLLLFVSLEIRHLWQGELSLANVTPVGELYTYSAVWLLLASAAVIGGGWRHSRALYKGGMALLLVVVAKLFLVDMSDLTGLWRVASFMGLGLTLLALAWLHQWLTRQAPIPPQQPDRGGQTIMG